MKYILLFLFLFSINISAEVNNCISVKRNYSDYNTRSMYDLEVYISDCKTQQKKVTTFGYFGDSPKINYYFFQKIDGINRLFISTYVFTDLYEEDPKYVYEGGKYNFTSVFDCSGLTCKENKKMSNFFADGANLVEVKSDKVLWKFPYEIAMNVKKDLKSDFFNHWLNGQLTSGVVKRKTEIYDYSGLNSNSVGYLISGDKFNITDISSRWLKIKYMGKNNKKITGWINCLDTDVCH